MEEKINQIERLMAPMLDGMQARHLHDVLVACLCEPRAQPDEKTKGCEFYIEAFLSAKRLDKVADSVGHGIGP